VASPILAPSNPAAELFQDSFQAEALDLVPQNALERIRAFEPVTLAVQVRTAYINEGLVPPFDLIVVAPDGRHTRREIVDLPLAVIFTPDQGGEHTVTLREQVHNRWFGTTSVDVLGDPAP
jgi:hypothetical protein